MKKKARNINALANKEESIKIDAVAVEKVRDLKRSDKIDSIKDFIGVAIEEKVEKDFPGSEKEESPFPVITIP